MSGNKVFGGAGLFILVFVLLLGLTHHTVLADGRPKDQALTTERQLVEPLPPPFFPEKKIPEPSVQESPKPVLEEAPPPKPNFWDSFSNGMIVADLNPEGEVQAAEDAKTLLGDGDVVYLKSFRDEFVDEGQWVVFRKMKEVHHPKTQERMGDLINVLGIIEVTHANKEAATAQITLAKEPILRKDFIVSVENLLSIAEAGDQVLPENTEGTIVEVRDDRRSNAQHDIVYIDYGKNDGVLRGHQFAVLHSGQRSGLRSSEEPIGLPRREVGNLVVLSTQDHTSTARIVESIEPISIGDSILFQPSR